MNYANAFPTDWSRPSSLDDTIQQRNGLPRPAAYPKFPCDSHTDSQLPELEENAELAYYQPPGLIPTGIISRDFAYKPGLSKDQPAVMKPALSKPILKHSLGQTNQSSMPHKVEVAKRVDFAVKKPEQIVEADGRVAHYDTEFPASWSLSSLTRNITTPRLAPATTNIPSTVTLPPRPPFLRANPANAAALPLLDWDTVLSPPPPPPSLPSSRPQHSRSQGEALPRGPGRRSKSVLIPREPRAPHSQRLVMTEYGDDLRKLIESGNYQPSKAMAWLLGTSKPPILAEDEELTIPRDFERAYSNAGMEHSSNPRFRTESHNSTTSAYSVVEIPERRRRSDKDTPPRHRRPSSTYSGFGDEID